MLVAYLDGSGHDELSKYVVVAGFVADVDKWVQFEKDWAVLLAENSLKYAHATDLAYQLGRDRRDIFYLHANRLLKNTVSFAVAGAIKKSDYATYFGKNYPLTVKDAIYPLAFRSAMVAICKQVADLHPSETVSFVIERGDPNQGGAVLAFNNTKTAAQNSEKTKKDFPIGTLTIADKKDFGALQAADMHAYGKVKLQESKFRSAHVQSHPLLGRLLIDIEMCHFEPDKERLGSLRRMILERYGNRQAGRKRKLKKKTRRSS
jgi:hypothetical protein